MIIQFLDTLPETFAQTRDTQSATGAAMQAALTLLVSYYNRGTAHADVYPRIAGNWHITELV